MNQIAAGADVPTELLQAVGVAMASEAGQVLARAPHALERAASWALGVRRRAEVARLLANKGRA
jgi:hypothetical protein